MSEVTQEQIFQAARELEDLTRKARQLRADLRSKGIHIISEAAAADLWPQEDVNVENVTTPTTEEIERGKAQWTIAHELGALGRAMRAAAGHLERQETMEDADMGSITTGAAKPGPRWRVPPELTVSKSHRTLEDHLNELREVIGMTRDAVEELHGRLQPVLYNGPEEAIPGGSATCESGFYVGNELAGAVEALVRIQSRVRMITSDLAL